MANLAGIIIGFNGNNGDIPALWSRVTGLNGRFPKNYGAEAVGTNGGADTHSHAGDAHTHAKSDTHYHVVSLNTSGACASYGGSPNNDPIAQCNHYHGNANIGGTGTFEKSGTNYARTTGGTATTITPTDLYASVNHLPPYHEVIFVKASAGASLKQNHIIYSDVNETPTGWSFPDGSGGTPDLRNRYLRGEPTGTGNAGTQSGALTHTHTVNHSHTSVHSHYGLSATDSDHPTRTNGAGGGGNKTGSHEHLLLLGNATVSTDTYTGTVESGTVEPVYYKLLALINGGSGPLKKGMIAMWEDALGSVPAGWKLCNGQAWTDGTRNTPNLTDKFIKIANTGAEIGNTGGSNTHGHSSSNAHTHSQASSHTHSSITVYSEGGSTASGGSTSPPSHNHTVNANGSNSSTMTWSSGSMSASADKDNQPSYRTIYYIQCERVGGAGGMLMHFL